MSDLEAVGSGLPVPSPCKLGHILSPVKTEKKLQALILTPTRELAIQVKNHLKIAARYTEIKVKTNTCRVVIIMKFLNFILLLNIQ